MKLDHIGYIVRCLGNGISFFEENGFLVSQDAILDENRNIKICFVSDGATKIELIEPLQSSILSGMSKRGQLGPYHLCFQSKSLNSDIDKLNAQGFKVLLPPAPAPAFKNRNVAFLVSPVVGLIEVLDDSNGGEI